MAKINNSAVIQKLVDELRLYPSKDAIPTELAEKILPVFQINSDEVSVKTPTANVVRSNTVGASTAATIFAVPATGKFYLTAVSAGVTSSSGAGSGVANLSIDCTIDGTPQKVFIVRHYQDNATMTWANGSLSLPNPILVDPSTNITITNAGTSGTAEGTIVGYTESD